MVKVEGLSVKAADEMVKGKRTESGNERPETLTLNKTVRMGVGHGILRYSDGGVSPGTGGVSAGPLLTTTWAARKSRSPIR